MPRGSGLWPLYMSSRLYLRQQGMVGIRVKWKKHTLSEQGTNVSASATCCHVGNKAQCFQPLDFLNGN